MVYSCYLGGLESHLIVRGTVSVCGSDSVLGPSAPPKSWLNQPPDCERDLGLQPMARGYGRDVSDHYVIWKWKQPIPIQPIDLNI